ncbi:hypothetical protein [uncultured Cohaesibacter sp.]|uniref:hypothetical protein n=1 Tax=uncultured Cohaesibacter sp. TaxID=1002546 RepID=UPI0029C8BFB8|nr:hypothetical protein [uncultured Cohaesibacter sp.]
MCLFSAPKVDNSIQRQQLQEAEDARQREAEREARITQGTESINNTFSQFDDNFYNGTRSAYLDYYNPQIDDQYEAARKDLTFALARSGTLNSSVAADKQAELTQKYDDQRASILSQANNAVSEQQSRVANEKSALVSQLNATGDATQASNEALSRSQNLFTAQPSYSPLGDIFAGFASGIGNYMTANNNSNVANTYFGSGTTNNTRNVMGS